MKEEPVDFKYGHNLAKLLAWTLGRVATVQDQLFYKYISPHYLQKC